jgi:replicative DNA helicase
MEIPTTYSSEVPDDFIPTVQARLEAQLPPMAIESEMCSLGSMMLDASCIDTVTPIVKKEDFYRPAHQLIFQVIVDLHAKNGPIDLVTVRDELDRRKQLGPVGGVEFVVSLAEGVPNAANAVYYAQRVKDTADLRRLLVAAAAITRDVHGSTDSKAEIVGRATDAILAIATDAQEAKVARTAGECVREFLDEAQQVRAGTRELGLPLGYAQIDRGLTLKPGQLLIIAGSPSSGKSAMAQTSMVKWGLAGKRVLFISGEMSALECGQRLFQTYSQMGASRVYNKNIGREDGEAAQKTLQAFLNLKIEIYDRPVSTEELAALVRGLIRRWGGLDVAVLDYLGLMKFAREKERREQFGEYAKRLKILAGALGLPIILLSQLNRAGYQEVNGKITLPSMANLKESGDLDAHANAILLLSKAPIAELAKDPDHLGTARVWVKVEKNRGGATSAWGDESSDIILNLALETTTFFDYSDQREISTIKKMATGPGRDPLDPSDPDLIGLI